MGVRMDIYVRSLAKCPHLVCRGKPGPCSLGVLDVPVESGNQLPARDMEHLAAVQRLRALPAPTFGIATACVSEHIAEPPPTVGVRKIRHVLCRTKDMERQHARVRLAIAVLIR